MLKRFLEKRAFDPRVRAGGASRGDCSGLKKQAEIQGANGTLQRVAPRYNGAEVTARKWRERDDVHNRSHRPYNLDTRVTAGQVAVVVALRRMRLPPLDKLLAIAREVINAVVPRPSLDRCLSRHGGRNLCALQVVPDDEQRSARTFMDCVPGEAAPFVRTAVPDF